MAKFKPAKMQGRKNVPSASRTNAIGCVVMIALLFLLLFLAVYYTVRQG